MTDRELRRDAGRRPASARERAATLLVAAAGLAPRLLWIVRVPTNPISDFAGYLRFAMALASDPRLPRGGWSGNGGLGMALPVAILLRLAPSSADPASVARCATAVATGLAPLIPVVVWRNVFSLRFRVTTALAIALWPGQIFFSGVFASDNWVILPELLLACLAVRVLVRRDSGHPAAAGLVLAWAILIRPEMALALLPAAFAASAGSLRGSLRRLVAAALAAAAVLAGASAWKRISGGPSAEAHFASSVLGTLVPGAPRNGWRSPRPYLRSAYPGVLERKDGMRREGLKIALREVLRRKRFHAVRMFGETLPPVVDSDVGNFYWSMTAPGVLPPAWYGVSHAWIRSLRAPLRALEGILLSLFFASVIAGVVRRNAPVLCLASVVALKSAIHVALVSQQPRYNVPLTPLEILCVAIGFELLVGERRFRLLALSGAFGTALFFGWLIAARLAREWALNHDEAPAYSVTLAPPGGTERFECLLTGADLINESASQIQFSLPHPTAAAGEFAELRCRQSSGGRARSLAIDFSAPLGISGRKVGLERVIDIGRGPMFDREIAIDPRTGWKRGVLESASDAPREFSLQLRVLEPDPEIPWAVVTNTFVRLSEGGEMTGRS